VAEQADMTEDAIAAEVGAWMMGSFAKIMQVVNFNVDGRAWCFKCSSLCRIHGPGDTAERSTRVAIAGTTCTSWSVMGRGSKSRRWMAQSALPFVVWAWETLAWEPDLIFHECTPDFDVATLQVIFAAIYVITTLVFSPVHLGWPASRSRRFTLLVHRERRALPLELSAAVFSSLFFPKCSINGSVFWCAAAEVVATNTAAKAEALHLPTIDEHGHSWPPRMVLKQGFYQRLMAYEKLCAKSRRPCIFIVNLHQNANYSRALSKMMPALLTRTSLMWSMVHQRCLTPLEHLVVMGVPVFDTSRSDIDRSGIELLAKRGKLTSVEITHAAGNGMVQIAIGCVLMFGLGGSRPKATEPLPSSSASSVCSDDLSDAPEI
jgi:hypothetical protein